MEKWTEKVNFRDLLEGFESGDSGEGELEEIKRIKPIWVERFNSIKSLKKFVPRLEKVETESQFNKWLDEVYDYCDANRIWVDL